MSKLLWKEKEKENTHQAPTPTTTTTTTTTYHGTPIASLLQNLGVLFDRVVILRRTIHVIGNRPVDRVAHYWLEIYLDWLALNLSICQPRIGSMNSKLTWAKKGETRPETRSDYCMPSVWSVHVPQIATWHEIQPVLILGHHWHRKLQTKLGTIGPNECFPFRTHLQTIPRLQPPVTFVAHGFFECWGFCSNPKDVWSICFFAFLANNNCMRGNVHWKWCPPLRHNTSKQCRRFGHIFLFLCWWRQNLDATHPRHAI